MTKDLTMHIPGVVLALGGFLLVLGVALGMVDGNWWLNIVTVPVFMYCIWYWITERRWVNENLRD